MRHKFRAWDKKKKKMYEVRQLPETNVEGTPCTVWDNDGEELIILEYLDWEITKNDLSNLSFMQFTGLKDENGKEIYEGDVVHRKGDDNTYTIEWVEDFAGFNIDWGTAEDCEVIGNIYQDNHLL